MIIRKIVNFKMLRCWYFEYYCAEVDSVVIYVNKRIMGYLCKKRNICLWTLNIVKIQKTLNKHSVTLSILHCSGLFCEISPSTQPSTCLSFAVSRRTAKHLWHLPRARSEPVQTSNVRDADNTHYSIIYVFYVCILKYIAITYTHICSACLTSYQKFGTNQAEAQ